MHDPNMEFINTWGEDIKLRDIASWDDDKVLAKKRLLQDIKDSQELVPRQQAEVEKFLGRVVFEASMRGLDVEQFEDQFKLEASER